MGGARIRHIFQVGVGVVLTASEMVSERGGVREKLPERGCGV
jgi:hypothetical protein